MMVAGYSQSYRKEIVRNAVAIYDHKLKQDRDGVMPLNRPRGFQKIPRRIDKKRKKQTWATRGGYIAPIIIPATPNSKLAKMMQAVCDEEATPGMKFKIVERGGVTIERQLQKTNPTASVSCGKSDCDFCKQDRNNGGSKMCHKTGVVYKYSCQNDGCEATYVGETSKNVYTRNLEHKYLYTGGTSNSETIKEKSFLSRHQKEKHLNEPENFKITVLKSYSDCVSRQVGEATHITKCGGEILNSKSEFYQPPKVRVRSEVSRGL